MMGIIKVNKKEFREGNIGIMHCKVTFLGLPLYTVNYTTTNRDVVNKLNTEKDKTLHICGFTNNKQK